MENHSYGQVMGTSSTPYVTSLADRGVLGALEHDPGLKLGVNVAAGEIIHPAVAEALQGHALSAAGSQLDPTPTASRD